jgi:hypothetical protein
MKAASVAKLAPALIAIVACIAMTDALARGGHGGGHGGSHGGGHAVAPGVGHGSAISAPRPVGAHGSGRSGGTQACAEGPRSKDCDRR